MNMKVREEDREHINREIIILRVLQKGLSCDDSMYCDTQYLLKVIDNG